ncbi:7-dehydrocholesterol reductase-like protein [Tasmannia lanceolata]|uniref:7-dehydrocholesterol reductase-like protein n=1 Tax=Tasmannia lanceolata TaxID=3420 RepID=UPI0040638899
MSAYENVVKGKLKLKGKALDVKAGGMKKKKKPKHQYEQMSQIEDNELKTGGSEGLTTDPTEETSEVGKLEGDGHPLTCDDNLTPAEKRYIEQRERLDVRRLARISNKSHRDRIQDFNQYLANLSEHYDIPKVGPG